MVDENTSERLLELAARVRAGHQPLPEDVRFLDCVQELLESHGAPFAGEPAERALRLTEAWKQGSRATSHALNAAFRAEQTGDVAQARCILRDAVARMAMPFYKQVLADALAGIDASDG